LRLFSDSFWVQKGGNQPREYEDAYWPIYSVRQDQERNLFRFAVADGATETSFSSIWARLLVRGFGRGNLYNSQQLCEATKYKRMWKRAVGKKSLPWYAEQKIMDGAFSSLVGITIADPLPEQSVGSWTALAIGDSCLVQVRGERAIVKFPFDNSVSFNSRPYLLCSLAKGDPCQPDAIQFLTNTWQQGDAIYLMTDALACWFMREDEEHRRPWEKLEEFESLAQFSDWVSQCRDSKTLKNDDVTLTRIKMF
jgi:hypothetical protein